MLKIILLALSLCILTQQANAEFDPRSYTKSDFSAIKAKHGEVFFDQMKDTAYNISAVTFKYRLPVTFSRQLRKISHNNRQVLEAWGESLRVKKEFMDLYHNEFKIQFGKETYWVPVQELLLTDMANELHKDDEFELYILLIGSSKDRFVFLATEFRSNRINEE